MSPKFWTIGGMLAGSTIGSLVPSFWGDSSTFSGTSLLLSLAGGILGIIIGQKISRFFQ